MNLIRTISSGNKDQLQNTLFGAATIFLLIFSLVLSFSPAVRYHSWQVNYRWEHWIGFAAWLLIAWVINRISSETFINRDPFILPISFFLVGWGLLTIFRLNVSFGFRQTIWLLIAGAIIIAGIKRQTWLFFIRRYKYIWLIFGLLLTALTFFFGIYPNGEGPRLWLGCCGFYIQPSEPLKLLFIIYLAAYLADNWPNRHNIPALIIPTTVFIGAALLILVSQRDLGTASIFIMIYAFYMFLGTGKRRTLLIFLIFLVAAGFVGYQFFDVIQYRVDAWINPWLDPANRSYQIIQSLQAIAAGKLLGSGPGIGSPGVVPVALSDFIYAAVTEETGLFGSIALLISYAVLSYRGFLIAIKARNQYQRLLSAGLSTMISIQAILIIGGNTRLVPLTGVTLPLMSYGGSSLISTFIAILLLLWVSQQQTTQAVERKEARPYLFVSNLILLGFASLALLSGWWAISQSERLLSRPDNLRRVINDRFVERGAILDRTNQPIVVSSGSPGEYSRIVIEPNLSLVTGYIHPLYGQSGLEASMDSYLRGLQGQPSSAIWLNDLLYSQSPPGLDIRISIDLSIQELVDRSLELKQGAAVVMNAQTGEILALWSAPTYNANLLAEQWEEYVNSPESLLLNRVTQGKYPTGSMLSPFLYAYLLKIDPTFSINVPELSAPEMECAVPLTSNSIGSMFMRGCQPVFDNLTTKLLDAQVEDFIQTYRWDQVQDFIIPQSEPVNLDEVNTNMDLQDQLTLSPLQVATAAASFAQNGLSPSPRLAMAVNTPHQGWVVFATQEPNQILPGTIAAEISDTLARSDFPAWEIIARTDSEDSGINWYLSGTISQWQGTPIVMVLVLEESDAQETITSGRNLMNLITSGILP